MPVILFVVLSLSLSVISFVVWSRWRLMYRAEYIRTYNFPPGLFEKLKTKRPQIDAKEFQLIARALRQFFLTHLKSGRQFVAMPSQVVDDLWHEFILYTRHYDQFCKQAFGQFMHHTPAVVLGKNRTDNVGLRRTWWYACLEENINPRKATRLPLLFALDAKLGVADGFRYDLHCKRQDDRDKGGCSGSTHCGGDFSDSSFDGSTDGFGDSGGGDSGSDGGGGCGGGGD
jgi:hypothetical protein